MNLVNKKLLPHERASILRAFGFDVKKDSGQVYNIRNKSYKDTNPSLCINLDSGLVKDHGDSSFNGDIFSLIQEQTGGNFSSVLKKCESIIGRDLKNADIVDYEIKKEKRPPSEFWSKSFKEKQKRSINRLKKNGIESVNYIRFYDHIWRYETLKRYACGLYTYDDYSFGESEKSYLENNLLSIPYNTGVMLYGRDNKKFVRHVSGSWASQTFFGYKKEIFKECKKSGLLFLAKSPRECMSIAEFLNFNHKVLGIVQGEDISELTEGQKKELLKSLPEDGDCIIKLLTDSDNKKSYKTSLETAEAILEGLGLSSLEVHVCSIYVSSDKKHKDFTDLCQASYYDKTKKELIEIMDSVDPIRKLKQEELDMFYQAITKPIKIIK